MVLGAHQVQMVQLIMVQTHQHQSIVQIPDIDLRAGMTMLLVQVLRFTQVKMAERQERCLCGLAENTHKVYLRVDLGLLLIYITLSSSQSITPSHLTQTAGRFWQADGRRQQQTQHTQRIITSKRRQHCLLQQM